MGQELRCSATIDGAQSEGRALLETDEVIFRGDDGARVKIPFKSIQSIEAVDDELRITHSGGTAVLVLGAKAATWAEKIRNPKSLLDKLGVKPGMRVAVIDVADDGFRRDLAARAEVMNAAAGDVDIVFLGVQSAEDMARMHELRDGIKRDGAVWVVYRKGQKAFGENDVLRLGLESGLVDVKVVRFSETHTATKFVIRKAER